MYIITKVKSGTLRIKTDQLLWRRDKVLQLKAQGLNHSEIARELQVPRSCIVADVQYLREEAKKNIKEYVSEHLPEQYKICLTALDMILTNAYQILQSARNINDKMNAMELFKDTHLEKLELMSNATTIDQALQFIKSKQQVQQEQQEEHASQAQAQEEQERQSNETSSPITTNSKEQQEQA